MGILNTTPDSFSDGGQYGSVEIAVDHTLQMISDGAQIIDIGGESTRPGALTVEVSTEIQRTIPVIQAIRKVSDILISIDTSKAEVAYAAIKSGADIVNDVTGLLGDANMAQVCIDFGVGVCVMHMQGKPETMQVNPSYEQDDVINNVQAFFKERLNTLSSMGMEPDSICFDPGIGFGKTLDHNLRLLKNLSSLQRDRPLLLGVSRKSMIGNLLQIDSPEGRDTATAAITAMMYREGIRLHRVHHVKMNYQALQMAQALD